MIFHISVLGYAVAIEEDICLGMEEKFCVDLYFKVMSFRNYKLFAIRDYVRAASISLFLKFLIFNFLGGGERECVSA